MTIYLNFFIIYLFRNKYLFLFVLLSVAAVLFLLPSTGMDYDFYKSDYLSAYYIPDFPFFRTNTVLTAEPFYKWYTAFISVTTELPFKGFLAFNFILCYTLLFIIFKKYFKVYLSLLFMSMGLISIVPTIFYFSPRSSISFTLAIVAFFYFVENKNIKGLFFSFLTIGFHSQFIPMLVLLFVSSVVYKYINTKIKLYILMITIFVILFLLLKLPFLVYGILSNLISVLPTGDFIGSKLNYFNNEGSSIRITALLSIVIFPILFFLVNRKNIFIKLMNQTLQNQTRDRFIFLFGMLVYFGFIINVLMFDDAHIAGRLSRMSDYFLMMVLLPLSFYLFNYRNQLILAVVIFLLLSAPILYPTLYNFNLKILQ